MSLISPVLTFIFLFSIMALIRLTFNFLRALLSTPPKTFELTITEVSIYGFYLSYIITYLIYI